MFSTFLAASIALVAQPQIAVENNFRQTFGVRGDMGRWIEYPTANPPFWTTWFYYKVRPNDQGYRRVALYWYYAEPTSIYYFDRERGGYRGRYVINQGNYEVLAPKDRRMRVRQIDFSKFRPLDGMPRLFETGISNDDYVEEPPLPPPLDAVPAEAPAAPAS